MPGGASEACGKGCRARSQGSDLPPAIAGGGIGGVTAALALRWLGHDERGIAADQDARMERAAKVQLGSRSNDWLKQGGGWVYGYDAWAAPSERRQA